MHPRDKLIADIIEMQEDIKQKKDAKTQEELAAAKLQDELRDNATKRLGKSKLSSSSSSSSSLSEPPNKKGKFDLHAWNLRAEVMEEKNTQLLAEYVELQKSNIDIQKEQLKTDAENAKARTLEAQNNAKMQDNFAQLITVLMKQKQE